MAFIALFCCISVSFMAQTMPTVQDLPYTQNFDALTATSTTYPSGFQGWTAATLPGSSFVTNATLIDDKTLTANSSASTTSGNVHNYNGKIGFLNTGSFDLTIGFAFNTTGRSGIVVQYDAMVIRNPYNSTTNTRISEMVLQYRVSITDTFTTLPATSFLSETTTQTSGTSPLNLQTIKVILPSDCNNQSLVQIRWISKQNSGSGSRPSFAIDNIDIKNDIIAPVNVAGFPKVDAILSNGFDFSTQIDEIGKTYYVLLNGGSAKPSIAQIKAGLDANDTTALQSAIINITDASLIYTKNITSITLNTNYTIYSISEDAFGNTQSDSNQLNVTTSSTLVPSISTTISSLDLGKSEQNYSSNTLNYDIQATNLSSSLTLTTTGNFKISKEANANFQTALTFDKTAFDANGSQKVYVRFIPNSLGALSGQITHQSTGATDKTIALSGIGINPYIQDFNDPNVLSNSGWTAYSVLGNKVFWASTTTRFNSSPGAIIINGYSEDGASKDWLISPKMRLDTFSDFPILSFYSRKFYAGSQLKLMVSTNYDGISNPETATWTELDGDFPTTTGVFKQSNFINLQAYKTNHTYLAWIYETNTNGSNNSAEWTVDDVSVTNETNFIASNPNLNFGEVEVSSISNGQSFVFKAGGYGDLTLKAPTGYKLSTDNISFQNSILITEVEALSGKTIYAQFAPLTKALDISGSMTITATSLNQNLGSLSGSSWLKATTFDIVSYNLEFFGSDVKSSSNVEFGPTDDALQIENVASVMNKLNADVYVVQEVSDDPSLDILIQKISINGKTFDKTISPSWSYSFSAPDPNFPPQKLVVIYNTQTTKVIKTRVMFSKLFDDIRSGSTTLADYPGGSSNSSSFFASGRLPYMVDIETNIAGVKKRLTLIDLHARANSGSDISKYNMRKYDAEFLKDSLDVHYAKANLILLGDYNDDVKTSVIAGYPSSFQKFVDDTTRYNPLTLGISNAGAYSYLSSGGFLDHIITSNELSDEYIANSIAVYDPRNDISNYVNTTSDHGPVMARFELNADSPLAISQYKAENQSIIKAYPNPTKNQINFLFNTSIGKKSILRIYDLNGKIIAKPYETKEVKSSISVDVSQLGAGIYLYTLTQDNKVIYSDKFIKE